MRYLRALAVVCALAGFACAPSGDIPGTVTLADEQSPFVAFNIWIKAGSQNDPSGKEGLASLTADLLSASSTQEDGYEQILEKLYPMAAGYGASTDKEMTVFRGRVHRDNLDEYYRLFSNAILKPAFSEADFERLHSQTMNYLERTRRFSSDEELGKELLSRKIFAGTPYEHPEEGYVSSMGSITLDDVKQFYSKFYAKNNIVVGIGGGYPDGFVQKVRGDFDTLPEVEIETVVAPQLKSIEGKHVQIVEKRTKSTAISFGYPITLKRSDPDFFEMMLANSWLGEHRSDASHLYHVIRSVRGMNYGDYSYVEAYPNGHRTQIPPTNASRRQQFFQIWIRPIAMLNPGDMHERSLFAFRTALHEHAELIENGLSEEDIDLRKDFLVNYTTSWANTISRRLAYAVDDAFYGIPDPGHIAMMKPGLRALTRDGINAAVKKHLQPDNMWIIFITEDAEGLKQKLVSGEPTPIKYSGEVSEDVLAEDEIFAAFPLGIPAENIEIIDINEVFER